MSIIDNLFNGWAKKNVPFGYDKRIVMPKSAQDTIPFYEVYDNGLFLTGTNTFTLIFAFSNIDYSLLRDKEQEETYQRYQRLLNALPVEINFQEFIMNSSVNTAKLRDILISNNEEISGDLLDDYNKNLETYITKSEDATSEKITLVAMSYTPDETIDNVNILFRYYRELQNFYAAMGSETHQLMPEDVFAVLYEYYHPFDNTEFLLPNDIYSRGGSIKDYIAPSMFAFRPKEIEIGNSYTRIMYMARYDRTLDDEFIRDILDNNCKVAVSKHIRHIDKSEAQDKVKDNIYSHQGKIQARLEKNHKKGLNFVPYHWMERERELEDLQERLSDTNCELFKIGVYISLSAATKEELDELTEAIRSKGKKHQVVIDCLVRQQEKALNSVLPFGINHFDTANGNSVNTYVLSDAAGILIPFSARSYFSDTGLCYGMNKHTNAIIVLDRAEEMNANGFILGTSGSGKSMYCKSEIIDTIIRYPKSEKIIIDPDGEYYPIIKQFGGDTLKLSADSETKINIFDTDINISENGTSAVAMKSELIMSIIETARGFPLSAADKSIIDSCVKEVYADYVLNNGNPEFIPTFVDFYNALINKKLPEADQIALDIELYVNGSFNTFSGKTNIHTDNKLLSIDISDMGEQLRPVGLQVILEYIWQRVRDNRTKGVQTWVWVDEFSIMFNDGNDKETVRSADFFQKVFKRIRKYGGIPTGITQNITEVLESGQARLMLSNSEFVVLLQQKKTDLDKVIELFNLSPSQSSYLKTGEKGTGLIVSGKKIIPFDRRISKDSSIYNLCQTDFRRDVT